MPLTKSKSKEAFKSNLKTEMAANIETLSHALEICQLYNGRNTTSRYAGIDIGTLAYTAGLFDGEGCVNFTVSGKSRASALRVMVRNTDYSVIKFLKDVFGGRIETMNQFANNPTWKTSYCWRLDWDGAVEFLIAIEPWVKIKGEQILVAKMWSAIRVRRQGNRSSYIYADCVPLLVEQMAWLNRKGRREEDDLEPIEEYLGAAIITEEASDELAALQ